MLPLLFHSLKAVLALLSPGLTCVAITLMPRLMSQFKPLRQIMMMGLMKVMSDVI
jgi:hypothetical protein